MWSEKGFIHSLLPNLAKRIFKLIFLFSGRAKNFNIGFNISLVLRLKLRGFGWAANFSIGSNGLPIFFFLVGGSSVSRRVEKNHTIFHCYHVNFWPALCIPPRIFQYIASLWGSANIAPQFLGMMTVFTISSQKLMYSLSTFKC